MAFSEQNISLIIKRSVVLGRFSKKSEVDRVLEVLPGIIERLRAISPISG